MAAQAKRCLKTFFDRIGPASMLAALATPRRLKRNRHRWRRSASGRRDYNYFRDYEPGTGRYVESDPIGLNGGLNTYRYAYANPLKFLDPMGLAACTTLFCLPAMVHERLISSTLTDVSAWRLENVHVEPVAPGPAPPTRIAGLAPLPNHFGQQIAQCFYARTKSYTDLYETRREQRCLEVCFGSECENSSIFRWKTAYEIESTFERMRKEREIRTIGIMHAVPLLRCWQLLGGLN